MRKNRLKALFILTSLSILLLILVACGGDNTVTVQDAWARTGQINDNGAVYFNIQNPGTQEDILTGASTDIAAHTELHMSKMDSAGVMAMEQQQQVPIPGGGTVKFEPGGLHIMLIELQRELKPGDRFPLRLIFETSGEIQVDVEIREH